MVRGQGGRTAPAVRSEVIAAVKSAARSATAAAQAAGAVVVASAAQVILLIGSLTGSAAWSVAPVPWLYEVAVPVASQSAEDRGAASSAALLELLGRLSGLAYVPRTPEVARALASPESYYSQFRFAEARSGPDVPSGAPDLVVQFDPQPVQELIKRAQLPIWRSVREQVLVWVVLQEGGARTLLGARPEMPLAAEVAQAMQRRARVRGLPLTLPLLDLEDQMNVSEAAVWGRLTQVLEPAAARYGADVVVVGRAELQAQTGWVSDWVFWIDGEELTFSGEGADLAEQAGAAVDLVATELADRRAVLGRAAGQLLIAVSGLRSAADYGSLLRYFGGLEFIEQVDVAELMGDRLLVRLTTPASVEQLMRLFSADGRLFEDQLAISPISDLSLVWRVR